MSIFNSLALLFHEIRLLYSPNPPASLPVLTENYRELYQLAKEVLKEEQERHNRINEKATRYLSTLTVLIGVWAFFGKWILDSALPPKNKIEWIILSLVIISLVLFFVAWWNALQVLRNRQLQKMPMTEETIKWFENNSLPNIYLGMTKGIIAAKEINRQVGNGKLRSLSLALRLIMTNGLVILVLLITFGIYAREINAHKSNQPDPPTMEGKNQMPTTQSGSPKPSEDSGSSPSQAPERLPIPGANPDVTPPPFETVEEGVDPLKLPKGETRKREK